ncbi:hypothetical protein [Kitasatospora sp. NPDC094015]|uniref:hypothetical protein n=1 Tax=Kitasatospora sp. NPDC094015 TaxID=3155205 RepID=UPI0033311FCF
MRTPVISLLVRACATAVAALTIGIGLPLTAGAGTALACGEGPAAAATTTTATAQGPADTVSGFIAPAPTGITAGGPPIEIGVEEANLSGSAIDRVVPSFALYNERASGEGIGTPLTVGEVSVEVMSGGQWTPVALHTGCDPVILADLTALAGPLADGQAHRLLFRVGLVADAPRDQTTIQVFSGRTAQGRTNRLDLEVEHPAPPAPRPSGTPSAATTPTGTPSAAGALAVGLGVPAPVR